MSQSICAKLVAVSLALMHLSMLALGEAAAGEIQRNPFSRPPLDVLLEERPVESERRKQDEWRPELRAVLVAGKKSVADLGGVILKVGESTHGYLLLSVREGTATFSRDGERVVISLYEQEFRE